MRVADREVVEQRLRRARAEAFPPGEFVGQESFVSAGEVLSLGRRAGIAPGVRVLDLCCGEGGPGLHLARELGCTYVGVDASPERRRAGPTARRRRGSRGPRRPRAGAARAGRPVRRRAPARDHARVRRQARPAGGDRLGAGPGGSLRVHARGGRPPDPGRGGGDARVRHRVARAAPPGPVRPEPRRSAGALVHRDQPRPPRHGRRPRRRVHLRPRRSSARPAPGPPSTTSSPRTASGAGGCARGGCASSPSSPRRCGPRGRAGLLAFGNSGDGSARPPRTLQGRPCCGASSMSSSTSRPGVAGADGRGTDARPCSAGQWLIRAIANGVTGGTLTSAGTVCREPSQRHASPPHRRAPQRCARVGTPGPPGTLPPWARVGAPRFAGFPPPGGRRCGPPCSPVEAERTPGFSTVVGRRRLTAGERSLTCGYALIQPSGVVGGERSPPDFLRTVCGPPVRSRGLW